MDTIPLRKLVKLSNYYKLSIDYITDLSNKNKYCNDINFIDSIIVGENLKELRKEK